MIDITQEQLLPIREVPQRLPRRPNGKKLHISAVYRWVSRGVRGVRLETVKLGGTSYTSEQALQRFAEQLNGGADAATSKTRGRRVRSAMPRWRVTLKNNLPPGHPPGPSSMQQASGHKNRLQMTGSRRIRFVSACASGIRPSSPR